MARVTVEDCVDKVPNRFDLVLLAATRARAISGGAELTIEGFKEYEAIRDFLYARMRDARERTTHAPPPLPQESGDEAVTLLLAIRDELRQTRELLQTRAGKASGGDPHV